MIQIEVDLFGALRQFGNGKHCTLTLNSPVSIAVIRSALAEKLSTSEPQKMEVSRLLDDCAFVAEEILLQNDQVFLSPMRVAVLPPVCGG